MRLQQIAVMLIRGGVKISLMSTLTKMTGVSEMNDRHRSQTTNLLSVTGAFESAPPMIVEPQPISAVRLSPSGIGNGRISSHQGKLMF